MPVAKYVSAKELSEYHDAKVKPSLDRMDRLSDAMLGDPNNPDKPGYLSRFHDVEKTHKIAKRGFAAAGLALCAAGGKWAWDAFKGISHSQ